MDILWLHVSKGDNISVPRERIAAELRDRGHDIDIRDVSGLDAPGAAWRVLTGGYDLVAARVQIGLHVAYPLARLRGLPILGDGDDPISDIDYLPGPLFRFFEW